MLKNILETYAESAPGLEEDSKTLKLLNSINLIPEAIEVKESKKWKEKDLSKIEDLTTLAKVFDWSFSSPYKGSISSLKSQVNQIL